MCKSALGEARIIRIPSRMEILQSAGIHNRKHASTKRFSTIQCHGSHTCYVTKMQRNKAPQKPRQSARKNSGNQQSLYQGLETKAKLAKLQQCNYFLMNQRSRRYAHYDAFRNPAMLDTTFAALTTKTHSGLQLLEEKTRLAPLRHPHPFAPATTGQTQNLPIPSHRHLACHDHPPRQHNPSPPQPPPPPSSSPS